MSATAAPKANRYFQPGTSAFLVLPAVADLSAPTRSEINAGKDYSAEIAAVNGFSVSSAKVDTPDFGSRTVTNVPGRISFDDSSFVLYADRDGENDPRSLFAMDQYLYFVIADNGDTTGGKADVYYCQVLSVSADNGDQNARQVTVSVAVKGYESQVAIPT